MLSFDDIYERIKLALQVRTQVELAEKIKIKQSSISDAKRRRSIPTDWLIKLHDTYDLNIDWLRWGKGPMYNQSSAQNLAPLPSPAGPEGRQPDGRQAKGSDYFLPEAELAEPGQVENSLLALGEPCSGDLPLARGKLTRVLSPLCSYEAGAVPPNFSTAAYAVLPEELVPNDYLVFRQESLSMEPVLRKGAYVGVNTAIGSNIISGEIYAVLVPYEGLGFRRIALEDEQGYFRLFTELADLPQVQLPFQVLKDRLIGKVVWTIQTI